MVLHNGSFGFFFGPGDMCTIGSIDQIRWTSRCSVRSPSAFFPALVMRVPSDLDTKSGGCSMCGNRVSRVFVGQGLLPQQRRPSYHSFDSGCTTSRYDRSSNIFSGQWTIRDQQNIDTTLLFPWWHETPATTRSTLHRQVPDG